MKSSKKPVKYHSVSIPQEFYLAIKKHISDMPQYRSVADFAKHAIRNYMRGR